MRASHVLPIVAACAAGVFAGCGGGSGDTTTLKLIEHAETDTVRHIGPANEEDSVGDVLAFANPVYEAEDKKQVGTDNGSCVRTEVGKAWECIWTVKLSAGQLTVEGPFYDGGKDSQLAITGGTASYDEASGQMTLHARNPEETEYDFTYEINE
jgi:hypothetical protein